jgi:hypothetical protein
MHSLVSSRGVFDSKPVMREWLGARIRPLSPLVAFLIVADLAVFLDYGHWRLVPALEQPLLKTLGSALYLGVALALASVLGWVLAAAWTVVMLRKIVIEEIHLRNVLRTRYEDYPKDSKDAPGNLLRSAKVPGYKSTK